MFVTFGRPLSWVAGSCAMSLPRLLRASPPASSLIHTAVGPRGRLAQTVAGRVTNKTGCLVLGAFVPVRPAVSSKAAHTCRPWGTGWKVHTDGGHGGFRVNSQLLMAPLPARRCPEPLPRTLCLAGPKPQGVGRGPLSSERPPALGVRPSRCQHPPLPPLQPWQQGLSCAWVSI